MKTPVVLFWSGGKDSALALYTIQTEYPDLEVVRLITTINSKFRRISMHGVREELLEKQAQLLGLPLQKMIVPDVPSNQVYETELHKILAGIKAVGIDHVVFGDIFIEDLRLYRDSALAQHGLIGIYPLWQQPTGMLINKFINAGFKTVACCISTKYLDESWAGKVIDHEFVAALPPEVDPCGENGEFHTFCFDGPIFSQPISIRTGEKKYQPLLVKQTAGIEQEVGFWYVDILEEGVGTDGVRRKV
ncbi:MAG: hypothetical protein K0S09_1308 [Sphingobacteriaceae bacterium]|jgi:uncharacterized protein (TIGR00290 family)|nr:hypothetical protein [Sphingobacteriaceae bacterium]